jgi:predicted permease
MDQFEQLRATDLGLTGLAGTSGRAGIAVARPAGESAVVDVAVVTDDYFATLGAVPRAGRLFGGSGFTAEDGSGVVISEHLWQVLYRRDPTAVGGTVLIENQPRMVIGVVAAFRGDSNIWKTDLWLPQAAWPLFGESAATAPVVLTARMEEGETVEKIRSVVASVTAAFTDEKRQANTSIVPELSAGVIAANEQTVRARLVEIYRILIIGAMLLLVVSCLNAMNLSIAGYIGRRDSLATRSMLGATRSRLLVEELSGAAAGTIFACLLGLAIGYASARLFRSVALLPTLPAIDEFAPSHQVEVLIGLAGVGMIIAVGLVPALLATRTLRAAGSDSGSARLTARTTLLRHALVGFQATIALIVIAIAGLLVRTTIELRSMSVGFDATNVVEVRLRPRLGSDGLSDEMYRTLVTAVEASPVAQASAYARLTLAVGEGAESIQVGSEERIPVDVNVVSEAYFDVLRVPLQLGRLFHAQDVKQDSWRGRPDVVIVNEDLAARLFGEKSAIGQRLALRHRVRLIAGRPTLAPEDVEIVGVVGNARLQPARSAPRPAIYRPGHPMDLARGRLLVRLADDTAASRQRLSMIVRDVAPTLIASVTPMEELLDRRIAEELLLARASVIIGSLVAAVACLGIASMAVFALTSRRREIAVRMALGATTAYAAITVLRGTATAFVAGMVVGLLTFVAIARFMASRVFGVSPLDLSMLVTAAGILGLAALICAWLPARRMSRVDPVVSLRAEG